MGLPLRTAWTPCARGWRPQDNYGARNPQPTMPDSPTKTTEKKLKCWKEWLFDEAMKLNVMPDALRVRIDRGTHPRPKTIKRGRLIFVQMP